MGWLKDSGDGILSGRGDLRLIWLLSYGLSMLKEFPPEEDRLGWSRGTAEGFGDGLLSM